MVIFKENYQQHKELTQLIYLSSKGFDFSVKPELSFKKQDKLIEKIVKLIEQYYTLLAKMGDATIQASINHFERTDGFDDIWTDEEMLECLMRITDKNRSKIKSIQTKIAKLNDNYFGLDELIDKYRPFNTEFTQIGI
jgi:RNA polymerase-binding transcription factor DksA